MPLIIIDHLIIYKTACLKGNLEPTVNFVAKPSPFPWGLATPDMNLTCPNHSFLWLLQHGVREGRAVEKPRLFLLIFVVHLQ